MYEADADNIHTHIQDYGLASLITHVVCVNLRHEWRDLQFTLDFARMIFEEFSIVILFAYNIHNWPLQRFSRD